MFKRWRIRKYRKQVEAQMIELLYDIDSNAGVMATSQYYLEEDEADKAFPIDPDLISHVHVLVHQHSKWCAATDPD